MIWYEEITLPSNFGMGHHIPSVFCMGIPYLLVYLVGTPYFQGYLAGVGRPCLQDFEGYQLFQRVPDLLGNLV